MGKFLVKVQNYQPTQHIVLPKVPIKHRCPTRLCHLSHELARSNISEVRDQMALFIHYIVIFMMT